MESIFVLRDVPSEQFWKYNPKKTSLSPMIEDK